MTDPLTIHDRLKAQYLRYYDTPFAVRDDSVMAERPNFAPRRPRWPAEDAFPREQCI